MVEQARCTRCKTMIDVDDISHICKDLDNVRDLFKKPFKYDSYGQTVFDDENNMVVQIRGWGYLSGITDEETASKAQDKLGEEIVKMLNL